MSKYRFDQLEGGYEVFYRGKSLGTIHSIVEGGGRNSFYLGYDHRNEPRIYRGMVTAAEALHTIKKLAENAKKLKLSREELVVLAWADRPGGSNNNI